MDKQKQKESAGKILMVLSFLFILSILPLALIFSIEPVRSSVLGLGGFTVFILGFELWDRNRIDINQI